MGRFSVSVFFRAASLAWAFSLNGLASAAVGGPPSNVSIPDPAQGHGAIGALGAQLPVVANAYGLDPTHLATMFQTQPSLGVDKRGALIFACDGLAATPANAIPANSSTFQLAFGGTVDAFQLHSLPGASRVIYLDFDGHTTSGTSWNASYAGGAPIVSQPLDFDGDPTTFNASERATIEAIWKRVAEDYAPFAIDVTTQDPGVEALRRSSGSDNNYGKRVVISPTNWYNGGAGGTAYIGSFNWNTDTPCFVFTQQLGSYEKYIGEAVSHEVGHTLGLFHDGIGGGSPSEYYYGHGDWAPIMGVGYYQTITQFSKGEYTNATNTQDDMAVIAGFAPLASDDHGNSLGTATVVTGPDVATGGTIESQTDVDWFRFDSGAGIISLTLQGPSPNPNLDIKAELLNAASQVLQTNNPSTVDAAITATVSAGTYYVRVSGVGSGSVDTGYSSYGSVGNYIIMGTFPSAGVSPPTITVPANIVAEATGPSGRTVTFSTSAESSSGAALPTVNAPSSGSTFPLGVTFVTTTATDGLGNTASKNFTVTVVDTTPPVILVPANITVPTVGPLGALVSFLTSANDSVSGACSTSSNPGSGSMFAVGTTTITTTASDAAGNTASRTFTITVSVNPLLAAPTGLSATAGDGRVDLGWNSVFLATGYRVKRATTSGGPYTTIAPNLTSPVFADTGVNNGTTYHYVVTATNLIGESADSPSVSATPTGGATGWSSNDIGAVGLAGSTSVNGGVYTISASGAEIWGAADSFRYVHQSLVGDGTITARVSSLQNTNSWAMAGVMIRESVAPGSRYAALLVSPGSGLSFQWRSSTAGASSWVPGASSLPSWVRLARVGNVVTGYSSSNGSTWTSVGSISVAMTANVSVGLAVTSHNNAASTIATFESVSMGSWISSDIGAVGLAGSTSENNGVYTVAASGAEIWGTADAFRFMHQGLTGDGTITARVTSLQHTNSWAVAGVMIRESLDPGARYAGLFVSPNSGLSFQWRPNTASASSWVPGTGALPRWVRLTRSTNVITGYSSADGSNWTPVGSISVSMAANVLVGLAVTSHNNSASTIATFDSVTTTPWTSSDVGAVGIAGSTTGNNGVYNVSASGAEIWGTADAFRYVYQDLVGDGTITARVTSLQNTNPWAVAGVMVRESLHPSARYAGLFVSPGSGLAFQWRPGTASNSSWLPASGALPCWVRVTRVGNVLTGYSSPDGSTWASAGSVNVAMAANVLVGLAVSSHNNSTSTIASFDSVTVGAAIPLLGAPTALSATAGDGRVDLAWNTVALATGYRVKRATVSDGPYTVVGSNLTSPLFADMDVSNGTTYYYVVTATNATGEGLSSTSVSATPLSAWTSSDVGAVGVAGSTSSNNGVYTVSGAGAEIWGTADAFRYVYQNLAGDGTFTARVTSLQNTNPWAMAGIMIRESLGAGARYAGLFASPGNGLSFQWRTSPAGASSWVPGSGAPPSWVRLTRVGNVITGFSSSNGSTWTSVGSISVAMTTDVLVGLAVSSHNNSVSTIATFDSLDITPWTSSDVGVVGFAGSTSESNGVYTVTASGAEIWGTADSFRYVHQGLSGDGTVIVRVNSLQNTNPWAVAGVMIRESLDPGARYAGLFVSPGSGLSFQWRPSTAAASSWVPGAGALPHWVCLTRVGNVITAYGSSNGSTWTTVGSISVAMTTKVLVGLAVSSHNNSASTIANFDSVSITSDIPALALPSKP